jgi:histidinol-phosphate phosphatase family protein
MNHKGPLKKAIFLDRDGTLIVDKIYLNDPDQIEYLPGVFEALKQLRDAGYIFLIVTNQSGIPRGLVSIENLNEIHRRMRVAFAEHGVDLLEFYYAPYLTDTDHPMRKPNPGMIQQGVRDYNIDIKKSWMIGDRMVDIEAGHRAQAKTIMVGSREKAKDFPEFKPPTATYPNIIDAVPFILSQDK